MIVCTSDGVYMPGLRPPGTYDPERDPRELQVRARRRQDLEILRRTHLPELGKTIRLRGTDYEYRAYCTRAQWGQALARIAEGIEYVKFKDTARDDQLHRLYLSMWSTILTHLSRRPLGWRGRDGRRQRRDALPEWWGQIPEVGQAAVWTDEEWRNALRMADPSSR